MMGMEVDLVTSAHQIRTLTNDLHGVDKELRFRAVSKEEGGETHA